MCIELLCTKNTYLQAYPYMQIDTHAHTHSHDNPIFIMISFI